MTIAIGSRMNEKEDAFNPGPKSTPSNDRDIRQADGQRETACMALALYCAQLLHVVVAQEPLRPSTLVLPFWPARQNQPPCTRPSIINNNQKRVQSNMEQAGRIETPCHAPHRPTKEHLALGL